MPNAAGVNRHSTHIAILHGYSLHRSSPLGHIIVEGIMKKMDFILTAIPEVNYAMVWSSQQEVNVNLEVQYLAVQKEDCFTIAQVAVVLPYSFMPCIPFEKNAPKEYIRMVKRSEKLKTFCDEQFFSLDQLHNLSLIHI